MKRQDSGIGLIYITYLVATENMLFLKYTVMCALEEKDGLDISVSYINECCSRKSVRYTAEARRQEMQSDEIVILFYSISALQ